MNAPAMFGGRCGSFKFYPREIHAATAKKNSPPKGHSVTRRRAAPTQTKLNPKFSIVFRKRGQTVRVGGAVALQKDEALVAEAAQSDEPGKGAVAELRAQPRFGIIFEDDDRCLMDR